MKKSRSRKRFWRILVVVECILLARAALNNYLVDLDPSLSLSERDKRKRYGPNAQLAYYIELNFRGIVPKGASRRTWWLCEHTWWWGRRPNPEQFWKGRLVWRDDAAMYAAHRYGRWLPPIPVEDPSLSGIPDRPSPKPRKSIKQWFSELEIFPPPHCPTYHSTEREFAYWSKQDARMSPPTKELENHLAYTADSWFHKRHPNIEKLRTFREQYYHYPPEIWKPEVLTLIHNLYPYSSARHTNEEYRAAEAASWRIPYLRRLRREGVDELYIEAYKKAWGITEEELEEVSEEGEER